MSGLGLAFKAFFCCLRKSSTSEKIAELLKPEEEAKDTKDTKAAAASSAAQLLAALQKEGRLIDFLKEELEDFPDAQVGSVARGVHKGCRRILEQYLELGPIIDDREGQTVTIEEGFDAHQVALVGKVEGAPPFKGVLRHHGWRLEKDHLPPLGAAGVLLPAEVELS